MAASIDAALDHQRAKLRLARALFGDLWREVMQDGRNKSHRFEAFRDEVVDLADELDALAVMLAVISDDDLKPKRGPRPIVGYARARQPP